MGAKINCSICGKTADSEMENCPHCGSPIKVGRTVVPVTPAPPVEAPKASACPSCGAPVQDGDIVCVRCGVNLLTGHKVVNKAPEAQASAGGKPYVLLGLLAAGLVIAAGVGLFFLLQDPVSKALQTAREGDYPGAVSLLQKHTDTHAEDAAAFKLLGRLQMELQQYAPAASAFDDAFRLDPADEEAGFMAVLAAGKIQGEAGGQRQIAALQNLVQHHPGDERALRMLALAQGAASSPEASHATLDKLAGAGGSPSDIAKFKGIAAALTGNYDAARASLNEAGPGDPDVRLAQGYVSSLKGETFAATDALGSVVAADQNTDREARTRMGLLHMAQGDFDKALPLLRPADIGQTDPSARFFYALCLETSGLENDALLDYDRLVSAEGEFAHEAAVQMAMIYLERGQLDRASESTRKAQKFGTSARLYTVEGQILMQQNDQVGAQEQFRKAISADENYPAAHLEQGLAYVQRGALSEGVRELKRYLELANAELPGSRINEVDLLVKQLEQAANQDAVSS